MVIKLNVKQMSVSDLVGHINRFKQSGVYYTDIRRLSLKDIGHLPRDELWAFLLNADPDLYEARGEPVTDRRRKRL